MSGGAPAQAAPNASPTADPKTVAFYDGEASDYAKWSDFAASPRLARFIAALPSGGRALDLGCGAGWAAAAMQAAGLEVRAIDASAGLVAQARARGVPAEIATFETLDETDAFDGIWASYSLLHAPLAAWPGLFDRIRRALRDGGLLYVGLKEGEGEIRDSLDRRYARMTEAQLRAFLPRHGFAVTEMERSRQTGRDGREEPCLDIFATAGKTL